MQEMQPQQGQAPSGGGITEALVKVDEMLFKIVSSIAQAQVPEDVKALFGQALEAYRGGLEALSAAAGGGGGQAPQGGVVTPEQGGSQGAVPMQPGGRQ